VSQAIALADFNKLNCFDSINKIRWLPRVEKEQFRKHWTSGSKELIKLKVTQIGFPIAKITSNQLAIPLALFCKLFPSTRLQKVFLQDF